MSTLALSLAMLLGLGAAHETKVGVRVEFSDGVVVLHVTRTFRADAQPARIRAFLCGFSEGSVVRFDTREGTGSLVKGRLVTEAEAERALGRFDEPNRRGSVMAILTSIDSGFSHLVTTPLRAQGTLTLYTDWVSPLHLEGDWMTARLTQPDHWCRNPRAFDSVATTEAGLEILPTKKKARMPLPPAPLHALVASAPIPSGKVLTRVQIQADHLSRPPRDPSVVVILDASASEQKVGLKAEFDVAESYVKAMGTGRFEAVAFQRGAWELFGGFLDANHANLKLRKLASRLRPKNGSNLGAALGIAAKLLESAPGPRRILVLTDGEFPKRFDPRGQPPTDGSVLDVALIRPSWTWPPLRFAYLRKTRLDHPIAPLAIRTGGTVVSTGPNPSSTEIEQLIRPRCLEEATLWAGGKQVAEVGDLCEEKPESILWWDSASAPRKIRVRGRLWSVKRAYSLPATPGMSKHLAALAVVDSQHGVDCRNHAPLSPQAGESWARSTGILDDGLAFIAKPRGRVSSGWVGVVGDIIGGATHGGVICDRAADPPEPADDPTESTKLQELLRAGVEKDCARAEAPAAPITFEVETTGPEIVAVHRLGPSSPRASCAEQVLWDQQLDPLRFPTRHGFYRLTIGPPAK